MALMWGFVVAMVVFIVTPRLAGYTITIGGAKTAPKMTAGVAFDVGAFGDFVAVEGALLVDSDLCVTFRRGCELSETDDSCAESIARGKVVWDGFDTAGRRLGGGTLDLRGLLGAERVTVNMPALAGMGRIALVD